MPKLSVILITKNEAARIEATLKSIQFADEIIVVDSASSDNTVSICTKYGATVFSYDDWPGFGPQKQRALDHATGDWVLSIDADEVVSKELQESIKAAIESSSHAGYQIRRRLIFRGQQIKYVCGEERILRLVLRQKAHFDKKLVHEALHVKGGTGLLDGKLWHNSFEDLTAMIDKMNRYTQMSAKELRRRKKKSSVKKAVFRSAWMFFRCYILKLGFLDGGSGFLLSYYFAENTFYKYAKTHCMA